jgi:hypothetical protein
MQRLALASIAATSSRGSRDFPAPYVAHRSFLLSNHGGDSVTVP